MSKIKIMLKKVLKLGFSQFDFVTYIAINIIVQLEFNYLKTYC